MQTLLEKREELKTLVATELPRLYSIARKLVGEGADDAVQDCMVKAFQKIGQLQDPSSTRAWLTAILVNCCRDRGRAMARRVKEVSFEEVESFSLFRQIADEDPFPYSDSLHLDFLEAFGASDVREVLTGLPEMYRTPLVLVHMEGLATKQVARMLGVPLGTVLARLHRGRKLFEKRMWDYAVENGLVKRGTE